MPKSLSYEWNLEAWEKGEAQSSLYFTYQIPKRVGNVAHTLDLLASLASVHHVVYVPMLKKYMGDPSLWVTLPWWF